MFFKGSCPSSKLKISDISALEHAYALKIRLYGHQIFPIFDIFQLHWN